MHPIRSKLAVHVFPAQVENLAAACAGEEQQADRVERGLVRKADLVAVLERAFETGRSRAPGAAFTTDVSGSPA